MVVNQRPKVSEREGKAWLEFDWNLQKENGKLNLPPSLVVARGFNPRVLATLCLPPTSRRLPKLGSAAIG